VFNLNHSNRSNYGCNTVAFLMLSVVFAYDSVLFTIHLSVFQHVIKAGLYLIFMTLSIQKNRLQQDIKIGAFALYLGLVLYLILPTLLNGFGGWFFCVKTAIRISYVFYFIILLRAYGLVLIEALSKLWFVVGVCLGVQSIILFTLIVSGHEPSYSFVERFGADDTFKSYGIYGFGNWMRERYGVFAFRAQSFFSEASRFAIFQIFPLCIGLSQAKKSFYFKLASVIILLSIITTFSFSTLMGLMVMLIIYLVGANSRYSSAWLVISIPIALFTLLFCYQYITTIDNFEGHPFAAMVLAKGNGSTDVRVEWTENVFKTLLVHPFGSDREVFAQEFGALPSAPIQWFLLTGVIGGAMMLFTQGWLFIKHYLKAIGSSDIFERMLGSCCMAIMVISVVHGNWGDVYYLLPMAMLIAFQKSTVFAQEPLLKGQILPSL
jgi:hypothetical protein